MSERLLKYFESSQPSSFENTGSISAGLLPFPAAGTSLTVGQEIILTSVALKRIKRNDRILLIATIGWQSLTNNPTIQLRIRSGSASGPIVYSNQISGSVSATAPIPRNYTASVCHVETGVSGRIDYILTGTLIQGGANYIGPISLTGSVMDENP